ncbi:MAG: hypothetical protein CMF25_03885 [Kangiellaceae bacterium]|nr:hypothetical protein [Kangiellaceae bacterium]|tara:strand:+ start:1475 stop:5572 length:4098 start_codon:yes stop_codon:yes gene_type:complete
MSGATPFRYRLTDIEQRLDMGFICDLEAAFDAWDSGSSDSRSAPRAVLFLKEKIEQLILDYEALQSESHKFSRRYTNAATDDEAMQHILDFCQWLDPQSRRQREDRRALERWLDDEAVVERCVNKQRLLLLDLCRLVRRLACSVAHILEQYPAPEPQAQWLWSHWQLNALFLRLFSFQQEPRLWVALSDAIILCGERLSPDEANGLLAEDIQRMVFRQFQTQDSELVRCCLMRLMAFAMPEHFRQVCEDLFNDDSAQLFVKRQAIRSIASFPEYQQFQLFLQRPQAFINQPPFVRLQLVEQSRALWGRVDYRWLKDEGESAVVIGYIESLNHHAWQDDDVDRLELLASTLGQARPVLLDPEHQILAAQLAFCHFAPLICRQSIHDTAISERVIPLLESLLAGMQKKAGSSRLNQAAAVALGHLWAMKDMQRRIFYHYLRELRYELRLGQSTSCSQVDWSSLDDKAIARLVMLAANDDFDLGFERKGGRILFQRGSKQCFRWWRWWYEIRHARNDKRQGAKHYLGRQWDYLNIAPSAFLAEETPTGVPGERRVVANSQDWLPELPQSDMLFTALDQGWPTRPLRLYHGQGITEIWPPTSPVRRLIARWRLMRRFEILDQLRFDASIQTKPAEYMKALTDIGFNLRRLNYAEPISEPATKQSQPPQILAAASIPFWVELWDAFVAYFPSVHKNTLEHLLYFVSGIVAVFVGRHAWLNHQFKRARRRITLSIGGWGTRGKSGTERLKAALFTGLGYGYVAKTTGCEAMMLYGKPMANPITLPLYRPYEKATIWEQTSVVQFAAASQMPVFLWECMALDPEYAKIIQRHWMKDDIATLTNTYPDHEDIQGPSGYDVAKTLCEFIPGRAKVYDTEQQMFPLIRQTATERSSESHHVTASDIAKISQDLQAQFPYAEHPANIALVLRMASDLGIEPDRALMYMIQHVEEDIGVLKVFPEVEFAHKSWRFINGMSANERIGAINNWQRMALADIHPASHPGERVVVILNNRADRISRSRVFARLVVNDFQADSWILIGSNTAELRQEILKRWREAISQGPGDTTVESSQVWLRGWLDKCRTLLRREDITAYVSALLERLGIEVHHNRLEELVWSDGQLEETLNNAGFSHCLDTLTRFRDSQLHQMTLANNWLTACSTAPLSEERLKDIQAQLTQWFSDNIVETPATMTNSDELLHFIAAHAVAGSLNHVIAKQNIKGPGLALVHAWRHWQQVYSLGDTIEHGTRGQSREALSQLAAIPHFGILTYDYLDGLLLRLRSHRHTQTEAAQTQLAQIVSSLDLHDRNAHFTVHGTAKNGLRAAINEFFGAFSDVGDGVKRRRRAQQIMRDLSEERIASRRAAEELRQLSIGVSHQR